MRARTRHELADALRRRKIPEDAAEAVLERMTEVGLVNDEEFARSWVDSRQQRRQLSRMGLRRELQRKGVDRDVVEEALGDVTAEDERAAARALVERRLRSMRGLDWSVRRRRLAGALARRGFSGEVTAAVLHEVAEGHEGDDSSLELP